MIFERSLLIILVAAGGLVVAGGLWMILFGPSGGPPGPVPANLAGAARIEVDRAMAEVDPERRDAGALQKVCLLYYHYGFPSAAASCYARAASWEPASTEWTFHEGVAREEAGEIARARGAFEHVLAVEPSHHAALLRLGYLLLESDRNRAEELFRRAIAVEPRDPRGYYGLGVAMRVAGDHEEALKLFREAVAIDPGHAQAHYAIAMILAGGGDLPSARNHLLLHARGTVHPLTDDILRREIALQERARDR